MLKISIVMPAYNCENYIEKSLLSIFSQTLPINIYEVIVVNDGSTDGTLEILKEYKNRIRIINQSNKGLAAACNRGIQEAKGGCVMRLDPDDYYDRELLSLTLNILETVPGYHCVYSDRYEVYPMNNTHTEVEVGKDNIFDMTASGILFRKEVFDKIGLYDNLLFEEYDFMIRFFNNGFKAYYLQKPLYYYVKHGSSMTAQSNYWENGWKQLLKKWGKRKLKKWVDIQTKESGTSRFLQFLEEGEV
jgi:glycosyltransferase involved in cell wall biosynthesis